MIAARPVVAVAVAVALAAGASERAGAETPGECIDYSPLGFCIEWSIPGDEDPGSDGASGGGEGPPCYWVTIELDPGSDDPTLYVDYGLATPPEGVDVVWQVLECSDGTAIDDMRWILPPNPGEIATGVRGRIAGTLPEPIVASSPAGGVAAIVGVPVFVEVTNWTGVVTQQECVGFCVTVTATPTLTFHPGEPDAPAVACAGSGTVYAPDGPPPVEQAAAGGACSYTYGLRTGAPGRPTAWSGSVSVTWAITWTATTGASGTLASVTRSTDLPRAVEEVQTVVNGGDTP
jgi:hypothetical protein